MHYHNRVYSINEADRYYCFGGKQSAPALPPTAAPAPVPIPAAQPGEVAASAESKRKRVEAMRYGALGTVRNVGAAAGVTGVGADLQSPMALGQKVKLGA